MGESNKKSERHCQPTSTNTQVENIGDFESYVETIFGPQVDDAFVPADQPPQDYTLAANWSDKKCVEECVLIYVATFRARVEVYVFGAQKPIFSNSVLQGIHEMSYKISERFCDFICMFKKNANCEIVRQQMKANLNKLFNIIKLTNSARKGKLLENIKAQERRAFLKCLKNQYNMLYENTSNEVFYDQIKLQLYIDDIKTLFLERFQILIEKHYVRTETQNLRKDLISSMEQWMREEVKILTQKNVQNIERVKTKIQNFIQIYKNFQREVKESLKKEPFIDINNDQIREATTSCVQNIQDTLRTTALQNYNEMIDEYVPLVERICQDSIKMAKHKRQLKIESCMQTLIGDLPGFVSRQAKKDKIPREVFGNLVQKLMEVCVNYSSTELNAVIINDVDNATSLPTSQQSESGFDSDSTVKIEPQCAPRTALKRINPGNVKENHEHAGKKSKQKPGFQ